MQEDEIGLRKALGHAHYASYVQCSRCGTPIAERDASVAPADALEDGAESSPAVFHLPRRTCRWRAGFATLA